MPQAANAAPKAGLVDDAVIAEYPEGLYHYNAIARGVKGFDAVGAAEIELFHEQGFLVIDHAFDPHEVKGAIDGLVHLLSGENPDFTGVMYEQAAAGIDVEAMSAEERQDYVRKFMWFTPHDERLNALARHPRLLDVVTRIMVESPVLFQDMALLKPPHIGREKPWHQDHAYFDLPLETLVMGVWVALDEATTENGCMIVIPGSHRQGPVVHFKRRDWQICDTQVNNEWAVAVPLQPGGCLLFHSLIHHGTPTNNSGLRRRAVQFHYRPQSSPVTSEEERMKIFGGEVRGATC
jgi:phytanoyl-CoA hydroxylase